jgi:cytidine deaminase
MTNKPLKTHSAAEHRTRLSDEAVSAAGQAYAPYSKFHVGAAVLGGSGAIYRGANIENASYGLGICAERVALANARMAGEQNIAAIAIACVSAASDSPLNERMPCGACRQWIQELAPDAEIFIVGEEASYSIAQLLPHAFTLRN